MLSSENRSPGTLRYISAGEVLPVLVQALTEPGVEAGAATTGGGAAPGQTPSGPQQPPRGGAGLPTPAGTSSGSDGFDWKHAEYFRGALDPASGYRSTSGHDRKCETHR